MTTPILLSAASALFACLGTSFAPVSVWLDELDLRGAKQDIMSPRPRASVMGQTLSIAGKRYNRGVGVHARSSWSLDIRGRAERFEAQVGVDDDKKTHGGSVEFQVWGDGKLLWKSGVMTTGDQAKPVDVALAGVKRLELRVTDGGDDIDSDHADWADAKLLLSADLSHLYAPGYSGSVAPADWNRLSPDQRKEGYMLNEVCPGVWKLTFGVPEKQTPVHYRAAEPMTDAMKKLPQVERAPLRPSDIGFHTSARGCVVTLPMETGEQLFGLGMQMRQVNITGKRLWIRVSDSPDNVLGDSHAPAPFYVSNRGYGVYVDTARYATFYAGDLDGMPDVAAHTPANAQTATSTEELYKPREGTGKQMVVEIPAAHGVDIYLFAGPDLTRAVQRYNLFSGGGCLPPMWGLGIAYRGYSNFGSEETIKTAQTLRESSIPCDAWGLEPGWQSQAYSCSFKWNTTRFPDPDAFLKQMSGMGYGVNLWEHAFTNPASPIYEPLRKYSGDYLVWNGLVPDFALPEARRIFADYHAKEVAKPGVTGFKMDECDNQTLQQPWSFPELSRFPSGVDGEQMHSLIGPLYQRTLLDVFSRSNKRTYGLVRASHALCASLPYVLYSDSYNHQDYVRAILTSGFGGLLWTPEVRDCGSVEELYRRIQTVVFSPMANINAWYLKNPPWFQIEKDKNNNGEAMPDHETVQKVVRDLFELRMSLLPYLYSAFSKYHFEGKPVFRHPVMDYPDDPNTYDMDDEYLVGDGLLVAPMFTGQRSRSVYLPDGGWYDFHTHKRCEGGKRYDVETGVESIPLFVKEGTILPLAKPVQHVASDTVFEIECLVFGPNPRQAMLFEDDGETFDFTRGAFNRMILSWTEKEGGKAAKTGNYPRERYRIKSWSVIGGAN